MLCCWIDFEHAWEGYWCGTQLVYFCWFNWVALLHVSEVGVESVMWGFDWSYEFGSVLNTWHVDETPLSHVCHFCFCWHCSYGWMTCWLPTSKILACPLLCMKELCTRLLRKFFPTFVWYVFLNKSNLITFIKNIFWYNLFLTLV